MIARFTSSPPSESPTAAITSARRAMPRRAAFRAVPSSGTCLPVESASPTPASTAKRAAARPEKVRPIHVGVRSALASNVGSRCVAIIPRSASPLAASMPRRRPAAAEGRGAREGLAVARDVMRRCSHTSCRAPSQDDSQADAASLRRRLRNPSLYSNICSNNMRLCRPHSSRNSFRNSQPREPPSGPRRTAAVRSSRQDS